MTRRHLALFAAAARASATPSTNPEIAVEMVGASHGRLDRVRELLKQNPGLANAAIDWGFGDWESALGAASHVGHREIAELLLAHGAVPTIFSAAMFGQLELVKAFVTTQPGIQRKYGPHGITLLAHAKAAPVVEYLKSLGDAGTPLPTQPLAPADRDSLTGRYVFGPGKEEHFVVDVVKDQLGIRQPGAPARRPLHHRGSREFYPAGTPWAKIVFDANGSLTLSGARPAPLIARRAAN